MRLQVGFLVLPSAPPLLLKLKRHLRKERRRGRGKERLFGDSTKKIKEEVWVSKSRVRLSVTMATIVRKQTLISEWNHSHERTSDAYYHVNLQSQIYISQHCSLYKSHRFVSDLHLKIVLYNINTQQWSCITWLWRFLQRGEPIALCSLITALKMVFIQLHIAWGSGRMDTVTLFSILQWFCTYSVLSSTHFPLIWLQWGTVPPLHTAHLNTDTLLLVRNWTRKLAMEY